MAFTRGPYTASSDLEDSPLLGANNHLEKPEKPLGVMPFSIDQPMRKGLLHFSSKSAFFSLYLNPQVQFFKDGLEN